MRRLVLKILMNIVFGSGSLHSRVQIIPCVPHKMETGIFLLVAAAVLISTGRSQTHVSFISGLRDYQKIGVNVVEQKLHPDGVLGSSHVSSSDLHPAEVNLDERTMVGDNSSTIAKDRTKRFIYKNVYGTFDFGVQIVIPYMIVLPPLSNLFNKWRTKRSLTSSAVGNMVQDMNEVTYFEDDPFIQQYVDRINSYFELIQIFEPACQQRAVCEFSAEPSKYFPISKLVLANLRSVPPEYFTVVDSSKNGTKTIADGDIQPVSLFKLYDSAQEYGLLNGHQECHTKFAESCFYSIDQRLDMSVLRFWKVLQTLIGLKVEQME